jgi:pimeloyl-ACP methyl ester carboxylesterase
VDNKRDYVQAGIEARQVEIKSHRTHYLKAGSGPPVVLVHGGASDSRDWINTMAALSDRFSFYAPDLIGFGQSERNEKGYYLSDFSDFLVGFIDELQLKNPVLVGHSFGARICLDVAINHQEKIGKLVLIDASGLGKMSPLGNVLFTFFWALRIILRRPQPFPKFLAKEGEDYNRVGSEELQSLKVPTLLIWKSLDPYMPLSRARRAAKMIPGAKLAVVNGYGHAPHQQENNEAFKQILLDFLEHG